MPRQLSYVFDQISIVATGLDDEPAKERYDLVLATVNSGLQGLARLLANGLLIPQDRVGQLEAAAPSNPLIKPFLADMQAGSEWLGLRPDVAGGAPLLQRPAPIPDLPPNGGLWIELPAIAQHRKEAALLCFYQIGDRTEFPPDPDLYNVRHRLVRDLAVLMNMNKEAFRGNFTIQAAPNWLCTAAGSPCSSPACPPKDIYSTPGNGFWSFRFTGPAAAIAGAARSTPEIASTVAVVIIDTSPVTKDADGNITDPPKETVQAFANNAYPDNMLLRHVADEVVLDDALSLTPAGTDAMIDYAWDAVKPYVEVMGNHGLFIAGIIHDIAPHVDTYLIRGMHEAGVSDVRRFATIMAQIPTHAAFAGKKIVVNMSADFTIPPGVELVAKMFPNLFNDLLMGSLPLDTLIFLLPLLGVEVAEIMIFILEDLVSNVQGVLTTLTANARILVVGAAGNDFVPPHFMGVPGGTPIRPEPRWPAYKDEVLSVAATKLDGVTAAQYSNRGDVPVIRNGVATFGGDATPSVDGPGKLTSLSEAIKGIGQNSAAGTADTGWLHWAGTSFATPIISALAAAYWDIVENHGLPAQKVLTDIVAGHDCDTVAGLNCPAIFSTQPDWNFRKVWWP